MDSTLSELSDIDEIHRTLKIDLEEPVRAAFLWGPRKVGKTTLLRQQFPTAKVYDLLGSDLRTELLIRPGRLREELLASKDEIVVIDEIQKVPALLEEVHWLLENTKKKFILCGSSARKLRREGVNLLGGRAWRFELFPLTVHEMPELDLNRAINHGLIPVHYKTNRVDRSLKGYILDYLEQEIRIEAATRNIPAFARFLEAVALSHGALINYAKFAAECGVSPKTVREYFQILEDTLIGHQLEPWRRSKNRRLIETAKFYLFDAGLVRGLSGMKSIEPKTPSYGNFFEHIFIEEVRAYLSYKERSEKISFWRTSTDQEVDLIVGDLDLAIEFKSTTDVDSGDAKGLRALMEDQTVKKAIIVSCDPVPRMLSGEIEVLPWREFCLRLWAGELF
jgi:predicted AAA+ superfamily ATPase